MKLWDEFSPNLYRLTLTLEDAAVRDMKQVDFGMRRFAAKGTQFTMNGRPLFLRGTLECQVFPKTGYPPTRRGRVAADLPDHQIVRAELPPLPLVVSARGGLCRGRYGGHR